jgi:hypothetical protein
VKSCENSDFVTDINEINVELSENFQRYIIEYCESEFDGKIDGFHAGCCKCRGGSLLLCGVFVDLESKPLFVKNGDIPVIWEA